MRTPGQTDLASHTPRRVRWKVWVLSLLALTALAYGGLITYLFLNQTELIFRPRQTLPMVAGSLGLSPEAVALRTASGAPSVAWRIRAGEASSAPSLSRSSTVPPLLRSPSDPPLPRSAAPPYWIVFLHGNDATRASDGNVTRYHQLRSLGVNILAPEYPGYADVAGEPSERGLIDAARAAYDALRVTEGVDGRRIAIYGWSLGSGGAVPLARDVDEGALIVEGAFSSVLRRAQAAYPYLPISWMVRHTFLSEDAIAHVGSPVLALHSPEDVVIPFSDGQRLFERAREPKRFVPLAGGHITPNLEDEDVYLASVYGFLTEQAGWTLTPPRRSTGVAVSAAFRTGGVRAALAAFERCRAEGDAVWNLAEYELEHVGRRLVRARDYASAIAILRANVEAFPTSATAALHLARAYAAADDRARARDTYARSIQLDASPGNPSHAALAEW